MQIQDVKRRHKNKKAKLIGRGGKRGTTSGKGTKGQKARSGRKLRPEMRDLIKRVPKLRGRGKNSNKTIQVLPEIINVEVISNFYNDGESVNPKSLLKKGLVKKVGGKTPKIKILGEGELKKKLKIEGCVVSLSAKAMIEKAGGSVK